MAQAESDRNLLFGILALADGLHLPRRPDRGDERLGAAEAPAAGGHPARARGPDARPTAPLLEPLVRQHIEQHGGDPARSLAALSSVDRHPRRPGPPSVTPTRKCRPAWPPWSDRAPATAWPRAPATIAKRSATASIGVPSAAGQRFRILRPHARGGLGEVYVARDEELHREVALKQIQDRHADHPTAAPGSCSRPRSPAGSSIRASCRSMVWATIPTAGRSTRCGSSGATASRRRSSGSTAPTAAGRDPGAADARLAAAAAAVRGRLQRDRLCPQPGRLAPRPEAGQHHARAVRRDPGGRLGPGQGRRPARRSAGIGGGDAAAAVGQRSDARR